MSVSLTAVANNGNSLTFQGRRIGVPVIKYSRQFCSPKIGINSDSLLRPDCSKKMVGIQEIQDTHRIFFNYPKSRDPFFPVSAVRHVSCAVFTLEHMSGWFNQNCSVLGNRRGEPDVSPYHAAGSDHCFTPQNSGLSVNRYIVFIVGCLLCPLR